MRHFVPLPSNFSHSIARNIETPITVTRDSIYLRPRSHGTGRIWDRMNICSVPPVHTEPDEF